MMQDGVYARKITSVDERKQRIRTDQQSTAVVRIILYMLIAYNTYAFNYKEYLF